MKHLVTILATFLIVTLSLLTVSCQNTVAGIGKDMQHTGQEIQKAANQ